MDRNSAPTRLRHVVLPLVLLSTALLALPGALLAESPIGFRQLVRVSPVVLQRGTERQVTIYSNLTLDGAHSVFFDKPGMTMKYAETTTLESSLQGRGSAGSPYRFNATVPADQQPGVYEVRVATNRAVSSVAHVVVTEYPVVEEQAENDTRETAQVVAIPSAVSGTCEKAEDVDFFRFAGKAAQRISARIYAQRITEAIHSMQGAGANIYGMDAILTLYGPLGQVLAQNDNHYGGDSFLELALPTDGDYLLEVRDARYVGDPKYAYCLELSDRPYVQGVFPLALQRGTSQAVEVVGQMPAGLEQTTLTATADEAEGWKSIALETPQGRTNQFPVLISLHPQIVAPTAATDETVTQLTLPVGVSGRFSRTDEVHRYNFDAVAGRFYLFEVQSQRQGFALDSVLEIYDAAGKKVADADDGLQTKDSKLYFKAPTDGIFTLRVSDLHGRSGPRFLYHLRAEPSGPDFNVHGEYYYAMVAPGSRMIWFARIERLNGFEGPVEMQVEGLPQGVTFTPVTIPTGMNHCGLILTAAADAPINASLVQVSGKAVIPDAQGNPQSVVRRGRITCELQTQGGGQAGWPIHTQLVGVVQPLDLVNVTAEPAEVTLKPGEKAAIKVRIERKPEYKEAVTLAMSFDYFASVLGAQLPPGVKMSPESTSRLSGNVQEGTIILEADPKAALPVDRLPIAAVARVSISFSITTNYASNPISLTILPAAATAAK